MGNGTISPPLLEGLLEGRDLTLEVEYVILASAFMHLKQHLRLVLSLTALSFGALILFVSLSRTASSVWSATGQYDASSRQLYMDDEVLPDHVLYPVLMVLDRAKLEAAAPTERIYIQLEYGQRRMKYAQELQDKENDNLALTTATKAQKYFIHAAQETLDQNLSDTTRHKVVVAMEYQQTELTKLKEGFATDQDKAVLDQLTNEGQVLLERLRK